MKLIIFFSLITVLSSVPQSLLCLNFIDKILETIYSQQIERALDSSRQIALTQYETRIENISLFGNGEGLNILLPSLINDEDAFSLLNSLNPEIHGLEILDKSGNVLYFAGDSRCYTEPFLLENNGEGLLSRQTKEDTSLLRYQLFYETGTERYRIILGSLLPEQFEVHSTYITAALESQRQYIQFGALFNKALVILFLFFSLPLFLLSILTSFILSDEIIKPIVNLEEATRHVSEGDYSYRILTRNKDELSSLVYSFNSMVLELDKSRKKILQTEKITAWQEIAQKLAHEIRNPLTPIKLSAERLLKKSENDPETLPRIVGPSMKTIIHEVEKLDNLLKEFRDFARLPEPKKQKVLLKEILSNAMETYDHVNPHIHFSLQVSPEDLNVHVDKKQMDQVLTNLIKNAIESIEGSGSISINAEHITKSTSRYCRIQIQDTGCGIPQEEQIKVFNPYYTSKKEGTGLGLSIVERILFDHNALIWFKSEISVGTTFFIDLLMES